MDDELVNRSAILELATYAMCDGKNAVKEDKPLAEVLENLTKYFNSQEITPDQEQNLRYIEQIELAIKNDPSLGEITVAKTSFNEGYDSPMDAVCFQDGDTVYIQYRGTPKGGWGQNSISFGSNIGELIAKDGVSSQIQADGLDFFEDCVASFGLAGGAGTLVVGGHSQGGNVAEYVTMMSNYGEQIDICVSLDAPNHSQELSELVHRNLGEEQFDRQAGKIVAINGNNDFVNMDGQISFAKHEYYIDTNDQWAKETGKDFIGWHDVLYMMDRGKGGLMLTKEQIDAMNQKELWGKLPIDEYAEFLAYLPVKDQAAFFENFPIKQQAQMFIMLPPDQQLLMLDHFKKEGKDMLGQLTAEQVEQMKQDHIRWQNRQNQPQFSVALTAEQIEQIKQTEAERENQAKASMEKALREIQEAKEDMFWGNLPIGEYAAFLVYLTDEEQKEFLSEFPPRYRDQMLGQIRTHQQEKERQYPKTNLASPEEILENRQKALREKDEAQEFIRVAFQAFILQQSQTGEQGTIGKFVTEAINAINTLPEGPMKASAKSAMGIFEMLIGSEKIEELLKMGLSKEDIRAMIEYALPAIMLAMAQNPNLVADLANELIPNDALKIVVGELLKIMPAETVPGTLMIVLENFVKVVGIENIIPFYDALAAAPGESQTVGSALISATASGVHAGSNSYIKVDTGSLRAHSAQMSSFITRLWNRAGELRNAAARESAKDEEERSEDFIEACYSMASACEKNIPNMERLRVYFSSVAEIFEEAESKARSYFESSQ